MLEIIHANFLPQQPVGIEVSGKGDASHLHHVFKKLAEASVRPPASYSHNETDLSLLAPYSLATAELLGTVPIRGYENTPRALSHIALQPSIHIEATIIATRPQDSPKKERNRALLHAAVDLARQEAVKNGRPVKAVNPTLFGFPVAKLREGQQYL